MDEERSDFEDVLSEERSRGRRPVDATARRRRRELVKEISRTIREGDEGEFLRIVRALGLKEGSPEFENVLRLWRAACRRQK